MENALLKYEKIFKIDLDIKNLLYDLGENNNLTHDGIIEYADKLYDSVAKFKNKFIELCQILDMEEEIFKFIYKFMENVKERIVNTNYTEEDLKSIYNKYFASMSEDVLKEIRKNIYGDAMIYLEEERWLLLDIFKSCNSVNELIHLLHFYSINNLDMLREIPVIAYKEEGKGSISLHGVENDLGRQIYELFDPAVIDAQTDIVITKEKILLTIRDRGHALQIETEAKNNQEIGVYYFIPKVLDSTMIKDLKGLNPVKKGDMFAFGSFVIEKEKLPLTLYELIKNVPTDTEYMSYRKRQK